MPGESATAAVGKHDERVDVLQHELAELNGLINALEARRTELVAQGLNEELWGQPGVLSPVHWVGWQCGLSSARSRQLVATARRLGELPTSAELFGKGLLSADQMAVISRFTPVDKEVQVAELSTELTVRQLSRALSRYEFDSEPRVKEDESSKRCSFGATDRDSWRINAELPVDFGARIEAALHAERQRLFAEAGSDEERQSICWADALVGVAENSLAAEHVDRPSHQRHLVHLHLEVTESGALHSEFDLGERLPDSLRRYITCDAMLVPVLHLDSVPFANAATIRTVPRRMRRSIHHRDKGCRIPGCGRTKGLDVHHIVHWEDGGRTTTANLICLCDFHHRLHHAGGLGLTGNADFADLLVLTDERGRAIENSGHPEALLGAPQVEARRHGIEANRYEHPPGERLNYNDIDFGPPSKTRDMANRC